MRLEYDGEIKDQEGKGTMFTRAKENRAQQFCHETVIARDQQMQKVTGKTYSSDYNGYILSSKNEGASLKSWNLVNLFYLIDISKFW